MDGSKKKNDQNDLAEEDAEDRDYPRYCRKVLNKRKGITLLRTLINRIQAKYPDLGQYVCTEVLLM